MHHFHQRRRRLAAGLTAAFLIGCAVGACEQRASVAPSEAGGGAQAAAETLSLRLGSERFELELAPDDATRYLGLGGRESVARNGGMLFVFPNATLRAFVMRDCPIPIDAAFLDGAGRVVAIHEMVPEPPQGEGESDFAYENRLRQYSSRFASQFVVETAGGRMREIGLQVGDLVAFDTEGLKKRAR